MFTAESDIYRVSRYVGKMVVVVVVGRYGLRDEERKRVSRRLCIKEGRRTKEANNKDRAELIIIN